MLIDPKVPAAGHIELEIEVALGDARDLNAEPVDAEDLAEEVEVLAGGVMDQGLAEVEELVGLHLPDLVAHDVAEGARLAARGGLPDACLGERLQDIQLVESAAVFEIRRGKKQVLLIPQNAQTFIVCKACVTGDDR